MASARFMQRLRLQMRVPAKHLPVFVARNEGHLLDGKTGFEESACALVPKIMKVKVIDVESAALASESCTHRSSVVGENS
jgi:hypothetical protein